MHLNQATIIQALETKRTKNERKVGFKLEVISIIILEET